MKNKYFLYVFLIFSLLVLVLVGIALYRYTHQPVVVVDDFGAIHTNDDANQPDDSADRIPNPDTPIPAPTGKIKADVFTGKLEKVDTGCFADGECFIEVDGKHVTALRGWSQETVGSVQGVEGFGDLEAYIGKEVEVYAHVLPDGTYSLYGSEGFYIKPLTVIAKPVPTEPVAGCVVGGCSSQFCLDASNGDMASTCEWTEAYACYQTATCERQASGQCGWTETASLTACLNTAGSGTVDGVLEVQ